MDPQELMLLAQRLQNRTLSADEFVGTIGRIVTANALSQPTELASATVDFDRRRRCGFPEVVFGPGKTADQLCTIVAALVDHGEEVLVTRVSPEQAAELTAAFPQARHNPVGRTFRVAKRTIGELARCSVDATYPGSP